MGGELEAARAYEHVIELSCVYFSLSIVKVVGSSRPTCTVERVSPCLVLGGASA